MLSVMLFKQLKQIARDELKYISKNSFEFFPRLIFFPQAEKDDTRLMEAPN